MTVKTKTRPIAYGGFVLPKCSRDIPSVLMAKDNDSVYARFALASEAAGIPLPGGDFVSIEQALTRQWGEYVETLNGEAPEVIQGTPSFVVRDMEFDIVLEPFGGLRTVQVGSTIEALEAAKSGTGWYVYRVITQAFNNGIKAYDISLVAEMLEMRFDGCTDDESFVRAYLGKKLRKNARVTSAMIENVRDDCSGLPSDFYAAVGNHLHLLSYQDRNKMAGTLAQAKDAVSAGDMPPHLEKCVAEAIALDEFMSVHVSEFSDYIEFVSDEESPYFEPPEPMGASCYVVWESPELVIELAQEIEQCAMQGGNEIPLISHCKVALPCADAEMLGLATNLKNYLNQWVLLNKLLNNFKIIWDEYEI